MLKAIFKLLTIKTRSRHNSLRSSTPIVHNVTPMITKQRTINELPDQIVAEILKRLRVKYILRCMCVKKSWYYLIKSPVFIKFHLEHQKISSYKYLFFEMPYAGALTVRYDDIQCEEYCKVKHLPALPMAPFSYGCSSSTGLICVSRMLRDWPPASDYDPNIYMWNPLIQKYKTLPASPLPSFTSDETCWRALIFGFVPEVNDHVVVHIVKPYSGCEPDTHPVMIGVYSLNTNSWKMTSHDNVLISSIDLDQAVFVNGAAFWLGFDLDDQSVVMCYETKTDILRVILLPDLVELKLGYHLIHPLGQSIAYFVQVFEGDLSEDDESEDDQSEDDESEEEYKPHFLDMWVLENGLINECSWAKKMRISVSEDILGQLLGVRNNGEPLFAKKYNLISYNFDNHEADDIVDSWNHWTPFYDMENNLDQPFYITPFGENLVLLNTD